MFENRVIILDGEDEVSNTVESSSWADVRKLREIYFKKTDLWYLKDRWDSLTSIQKEELNAFRQTMRNLPQEHSDATQAMSAFPSPESWF